MPYWNKLKKSFLGVEICTWEVPQNLSARHLGDRTKSHPWLCQLVQSNWKLKGEEKRSRPSFHCVAVWAVEWAIVIWMFLHCFARLSNSRFCTDSGFFLIRHSEMVCFLWFQANAQFRQNFWIECSTKSQNSREIGILGNSKQIERTPTALLYRRLWNDSQIITNRIIRFDWLS